MINLTDRLYAALFARARMWAIIREGAEDMQQAEPELAIVIPMEDELVHTDDFPFCDDPTCGCHYDLDLLEQYIGAPLDNGLFTPAEAARFRYGKQI